MDLMKRITEALCGSENQLRLKSLRNDMKSRVNYLNKFMKASPEAVEPYHAKFTKLITQYENLVATIDVSSSSPWYDILPEMFTLFRNNNNPKRERNEGDNESAAAGSLGASNSAK
jgi:hypothetical protein